MEKHNKDLENIIIKRVSLQVTLKQIDANCWNLKAEKDTLNIKHSKLQKDYKNMEQTFLEAIGVGGA
jgi:hypothetical protein